MLEYIIVYGTYATTTIIRKFCTLKHRCLKHRCTKLQNNFDQYTNYNIKISYNPHNNSNIYY